MSLTPPSPSLFGGSSTFDMTHDDSTTVTNVTKQEVYKRVTDPVTTTTTTVTSTTIPTTAATAATNGGPVITEIIEESVAPNGAGPIPVITTPPGTDSKLLVHLNLEDMTKNAAQAVQIEGKEADKASAIVTADKDTVTMQIDLKGLDGQRVVQRRSVRRSANKGASNSKALVVKTKDGKPETEEERRIRMLTTRKNELNQRLNIWKGIFIQKHMHKPTEADMAKHADLVRWFGELTEIRKELADLGFYQYPVKPTKDMDGQQSPRRAPKFEGYVPDEDDQIEMHNDKLKRQLGEWRAAFLSQFGRNPTEEDIQQHSNIYKVYLELTANRQHAEEQEVVEEEEGDEEDE